MWKAVIPMRMIEKIAIATAAAGAALLAAPAAHAGLLDGSANNADLLGHIGLLNSNLNSDATTTEVGNSNSRPERPVADVDVDLDSLASAVR
ncbi:hypothetical protein ADL03_21550 [Nocardia sp. NRRL S-836]|nr:hypothetical protein ADL03_21550 [Nocardia sp. NRRL S-836]